MFPSYDGIASAPNRVYASVDGQLGAFDISDPFDPALLGTVSMAGGGGGPLRVTDDGSYVVNHPGQDYLYVIENGTVHLLADLPGYCEAVCGNGSVEYPEACDDGDLESGDECDADCTL